MSIATIPDPFGPPIIAGQQRAWLAGPEDMPAVMALRSQAFRNGADDTDCFDGQVLHLCAGPLHGSPTATVRVALHLTGDSLCHGYASQWYDLRGLAARSGVVLELGRLCGRGNGDALRLIWAAVARLVMNCEAERLVGCTSFPTTNPVDVAPVLARLNARHVGPDGLCPRVVARESQPLAAFKDMGEGAEMPALLRFYLMLGAWVSDRVVIDRALGTCHVFTCVDMATMPPARRKTLSRVALQAA